MLDYFKAANFLLFPALENCNYNTTGALGKITTFNNVFVPV